MGLDSAFLCYGHACFRASHCDDVNLQDNARATSYLLGGYLTTLNKYPDYFSVFKVSHWDAEFESLTTLNPNVNSLGFDNKMMIKVHYNRDFIGKNYVPAPGLEPAAFGLMSSCQGVTLLTGIRISPINHFDPW